MIAYQPIARKYRPKLFREVFGQEAIVTTLKNALKRKKVASSYLFSGTRGTGKTTLARLFARAINCEALTRDFEPCNSCSSCLEMLKGSSMELIEIDGASNRGIDDIRTLSESVSFAPPNGRLRVYLIDEVHMLTKEAFNALLKTLEEPPSHVKFFFATTEPHKIPITILSRCQKFDLSRIQQKDIYNKLAWIVEELGGKADKSALELIAIAGEGSLRDAESLLDQLLCQADNHLTHEIVLNSLGRLSKKAFFEIDLAFHTNDVQRASLFAKSLFNSGKECAWLIEELIEHFRNHLLFLTNPNEHNHLSLSEEEIDLYQKGKTIYSKGILLSILELLHQQLALPTRPEISLVRLETLLFLVLKKGQRLDIEGLIDRLEAIEERLKSSTSQIESTKQSVESIPVKAVEEEPIPSPTPTNVNGQSRTQTLIQFAAVELNALIVS